MKLYSIKPLEWEEVTPGCFETTIYRFCSIMIYRILRYDTRSVLSLQVEVSGDELHEFEAHYSSFDAAKSKAQEDWNNRISQYLTEYKEAK